MAIAWTLRDPRVTSALIGVSSLEQLEDNLGALDNLEFSADELAEIDRYAQEGEINLWAGSASSQALLARLIAADAAELDARGRVPARGMSACSTEVRRRRRR